VQSRATLHVSFFMCLITFTESCSHVVFLFCDLRLLISVRRLAVSNWVVLVFFISFKKIIVVVTRTKPRSLPYKWSKFTSKYNTHLRAAIGFSSRFSRIFNFLGKCNTDGELRPAGHKVCVLFVSALLQMFGDLRMQKRM
jgi:hypothetical protein